MKSGSIPELDPAVVVAWIAATYGIEIPHAVAVVAAAELTAASRHVLGHAGDGANADSIDFFDCLLIFADDEA